MPRRTFESPVRNMLLAALSAAELQTLQERGEVVDLELKHILHEAGEETPHVYFPLSGVISLLTVLDDGSAVEIATVGNEGMADLPAYLGLESTARWLVQVPGKALRLEASTLRRLAIEAPTLNNIMHNYMLAMYVLVSQTAACNRRHPVEERCARWLLMTHDRVDGDGFPMTHEFLSDMLGVRRPSVSIAMNTLSRAGLISYRRGKVDVVDRDGLESASCECYPLLAEHFDRYISFSGSLNRS